MPARAVDGKVSIRAQKGRLGPFFMVVAVSIRGPGAICDRARESTSARAEVLLHPRTEIQPESLPGPPRTVSTPC